MKPKINCNKRQLLKLSGFIIIIVAAASVLLGRSQSISQFFTGGLSEEKWPAHEREAYTKKIRENRLRYQNADRAKE